MATDQARRNEVINVLELMMWYGKVHTITGFSYPEGTHEAAIRRCEIVLNQFRLEREVDIEKSFRRRATGE